MSSLLFKFHPEYFLSIYNTFYILYELRMVGVTTRSVCLSTCGKPFSYYSSKFGPGISGFSLSNFSTSSLAFSNPSTGSQVFSSSEHPAHFTKYQSFLNYLFTLLTFLVYVIIALLTILSTSHSRSPSTSSGSRGGCSRLGRSVT